MSKKIKINEEVIKSKYSYNYLVGVLRANGVLFSKSEYLNVYNETIKDLYKVASDNVTFFNNFIIRINRFQKEFSEYKEKLKENNLYENNDLLIAQQDNIDMLKKQVDDYYLQMDELLKDSNIRNGEFEEKLYDFLAVHRYLLSRIASVVTMIDWQSVSLESSKRCEIFESKEFDYKGTLGYKRVHYPKLIEFEKNFLDEFIDAEEKENLVCLFTNSGQSAFATLKEMIFTMLLKGRGKVLLSSNGYYETRVLVNGIKSFKCKYFKKDEEKTILKQVIKEKPDLLVLEPYYCNDKITLIDINEILSGIDKLNLSKDIYVIVDASMMSGAIQPYSNKINNEKIHIFLMESFIKYRQYGTDKVNAGFLIGEKKYLGKLITARGCLGAALNNIQLETLARTTRTMHDERMKIVYRNAMYICEEIEKFCKDKKYSMVKGMEYPGLNTHNCYNKKSNFKYLNGIVNVKFDNDYYKNFASLLYFIRKVIDKANEKNISVNHGTSFGFDWTRMSVADSGGGSFANQFVRISVGRENFKDIIILTRIIEDCIEKYLKY